MPRLIAALFLAPLLFAQDLSRMVDNYLTGIATPYWEARARQVAAIRTRDDVLRRQGFIRQTILEEIGGFPQRTPLNPRITGTLERNGYRVEKLIFESQPRYYVTANVYVPQGSGPFPAVLGASGHDDESKEDPDYQRVWISLVKRGFLVLAYDPPAQGERSEDVDPKTNQRRRLAEHNLFGAPCMLTGTNFARYEIWDGIRAIDYLVSRHDVDARRIGVAGHSGGGTQAAYLAALDPRLAAATPTCYITSWQRLWLPRGPQDAEQTFPGFLKDGLGFGDFLIAFAPRPMRVLSARRDVFPIQGTRETVAEAHRIYTVMGAANHLDLIDYDGEHHWAQPLRQSLYNWMQQWLHDRKDDGAEAKIQAEAPRTLHCTPTGKIATSLRGETTQSLNQALAERLYRSRTALHLHRAAELRPLIMARLAENRISLSAVPAHSTLGNIQREKYRIEKIALRTESGITVPAQVFVPDGDKRPKPAVVWVDSARPLHGMEELALAGYIVMAPDLRGWGESYTQQWRVVYDGSWQTPFRALLVGKTMTGMQVFDLLRSVDYLVSRGDVDRSRIAVLGQRNGAVISIYAAALDARIRKVACESAVTSYMSIVRAKDHHDMLELIVPGVLNDFDLPDVAASIAPRSLWIADPRTPAGAVVSPAECLREYVGTVQEYRAAGRPDSFRVIGRPERLAWLAQ